MKKRILFLGDLCGGGKERRMSELLRYLNICERYDLYLMLNKKAKRDYPQALQCVNGVCEIDFSGSKLQVLRQIRECILTIKPDIVHSWHEILSVYVGILKPILPKFYYIAGFVADANKDGFVRGVADRLTYLLSDIVISNSQAGLIAHKVPLWKSKVIYNGFNEDRIPPINDEEALRFSLDVVDAKVVAMIGRFQRGKDFDTFLDAIKIVNKHTQGIKFLLIGQGENLERYRKRVSDETIKNVIFTGFRDDIEKIMMITDIVVQCTNASHNEGVSNVIMEALAMGVPVIATNAGGTPEIIDKGVNGYLIEAGDSVALASNIEKLINDSSLRRKLSEGGKNTIANKFTIKKMVDDYCKIYDYALK